MRQPSISLLVVVAGPCGFAAAQPPPLLLQRTPASVTIADLGTGYSSASISDIEPADFDRDGLTDLAVAWYASSEANPPENRRSLTFLYGTAAGGFTRGTDINLYIRNTNLDSMSIFRNGTSELAVGDFDGDGDLDLSCLAFFGDEVWFVENSGPRAYVPRLRYVFGLNSPGNNLTPPEALAADFDRDGRDDVVYLADPIQRIYGLTVHFWRTSTSMASMTCVPWDGVSDTFTNWTRGLAVTDFDSDQRPDLCFNATTDPAEEVGPTLVFWAGLNLTSRLFEVRAETPAFVGSDVVPLRPPAWCAPGVALSDRDGTAIEIWRPQCDGSGELAQAAVVEGFEGCSPNRGMAVAEGDLNGDGEPDLATRQKVGDESSERVEIVLGHTGGQTWERLDPNPIDSTGYADPASNEILRPRNLAVADVFGNRLPEIVAGFGPTPTGDPGLGRLEIVIWRNSCLADVSRDGRTDVVDLAELLAAAGCLPDANYRADADLDRDGCIGLSDLSLLLSNFGCECCGD